MRDNVQLLSSNLLTDKLKGSSQVTHIRGKARFFYDYSFELSFQILSITAEVFVGDIKLFYD